MKKSPHPAAIRYTPYSILPYGSSTHSCPSSPKPSGSNSHRKTQTSSWSPNGQYNRAMSELEPIIAAFAGGVLPALAWLWFWRREDSVHPEPRRLIALAFLAGTVGVAVVRPLEKFAASYLKTQELWLLTAASTTTLTFIIWSAMEEIIKFVMAKLTVLRRREDDEPIDPVIYMVTAALGIAFYKSRRAKRWYTFIGVILAILLHSTFNFLILNTPEEHLLRTFGLVWIGLVALLAVLEYIKRIHPVIKKTVWRS